MSVWGADAFAETAGGRWLAAPADDAALDFCGASIDTRSLERGQIFFAFKGEQVDGHRYVKQAADAGASVCIVTDASSVPADMVCPVLVVAHALDAMTRLADAWRERISARVIAITGSNGKTTSCRLMHSICSVAGRSFVSPKSFNNAIGVPLTVLNTAEDCDFLVAEVGMSTPGEIEARTRLLRPDVSVITSLGRAHLEALGSVANIAREKSKLISCAPQSAVGVMSSGIAELEVAVDGTNHRIVRLAETFELQDVTTVGNRFSVDGAEFMVPLPGIHNAVNAALCVLAARVLGIDDVLTRRGLAQAVPPSMRFERVQIDTGSEPIVVINDAYNANPDSMRAALSTFDLFPASGRKVAILGEMLEMGEASESEHVELVEHVLGMDTLDRIILVGASFPCSGEEVERVVRVADSSNEGMQTAAQQLLPGDLVLMKGSRGVQLERVIEAVKEQYEERSETHA